MEAELICKGLWGMVEVAVETERKDNAMIAAKMQTKKCKWTAQKIAKARAKMILHVEAGQLTHEVSTMLADLRRPWLCTGSSSPRRRNSTNRCKPGLAKSGARHLPWKRWESW